MIPDLISFVNAKRALRIGTILYLLSVYAAIPLARTVQNGLEGWMGRSFGLFIAGSGCLVFLGLVVFVVFVKQDRRLSSYAMMSCAGLTLAILMAQTRLEVEKIHLLQYGVLGGLLAACFELTRRFRRIAWVILIGFCAGLVDELIQGCVPRRFFDWRDVGLNMAGTVIGVWISLPVLQPSHE